MSAYSSNNLSNNSNYFYFDSLELGYEQIKFSLLGVAGVYKLINKRNPKRFYIGSSVNLARRCSEYIHLTNGVRTPQSTSEGAESAQKVQLLIGFLLF